LEVWRFEGIDAEVTRGCPLGKLLALNNTRRLALPAGSWVDNVPAAATCLCKLREGSTCRRRPAMALWPTTEEAIPRGAQVRHLRIAAQEKNGCGHQ